MSQLSKIEQSIINTICDPDAARMATSLDRALTHMVQSNLQHPCNHFEDDYYNVDRLRYVIREFVQSENSQKTEKQAAEEKNYTMYPKELLIQMLLNMDKQVATCEKIIKVKEDFDQYHKQIIERLQAKIDQNPALDPRLEPFKKLLEIDIDYLLQHTEEVFSMLIGHLADYTYSQQFIAQKINVLNDIRIALSEVAQLSKQEATA